MSNPFIEGINYFVNNVSITVILLLKIKTNTIILTKVFRKKSFSSCPCVLSSCICRYWWVVGGLSMWFGWRFIIWISLIKFPYRFLHKKKKKPSVLKKKEKKFSFKITNWQESCPPSWVLLELRWRFGCPQGQVIFFIFFGFIIHCIKVCIMQIVFSKI